MDFELTEDQRALQDVIRRFVEKEMPKQQIAAWDKKGEFPDDLLDRMVDIGLMGASVPKQYGGTGGGVVEEVIILEEIARHSSTIAMAYGMDICFGAVTIERHGSQEQRDWFLPRLVAGQCHFALSMTEPDGGTDILGAMKTTARREGDDYVINGAKVYTTGLPWPDGFSHFQGHARSDLPKNRQVGFLVSTFL